MPMRRGKRLALWAIVLLAAVTSSRASPSGDNAKTVSLWFVPRNQPPIPAVDFMDLFKPDAPWPKAAAHVQVFGLYPKFVYHASDADLKAVIVGLQQRHIPLAIEAGLLTKGKIESYGGEHFGFMLARIKNLGGDLQYVAMDEPLWFGHVSNLPAAHHTSIADLAKDVAHQVATLHHYFPNAQVGDIEPVAGAGGPSDYVSEVRQFADAYKAAVGCPLVFIDTDIAWKQPGWQTQLEELCKLTRAQGIKFGIIYDGNADDETGVEWTAHAEQRFAEIESNPQMVPDDAVIQSWETQPERALPETQPGTMTYLVDRYLAAQTALQASKTATGFAGSLTTARGTPVDQAQVSAYEIDDGSLNLTWTASRQAIVPPEAVQALFAVRINVNDTHFNSPVNIHLGPVQYVDKTSDQTVVHTLTPADGRIVLAAGQRSTVDSGKFPVKAGNACTFSASMQVPYSSKNCGYVALVFLDHAGHEVLPRVELPFQPGRRLIWMGSTDPQGRFTVQMPKSTPVPSIVTFDFPGSQKLRLNSMTYNVDPHALRRPF